MTDATNEAGETRDEIEVERDEGSKAFRQAERQAEREAAVERRKAVAVGAGGVQLMSLQDAVETARAIASARFSIPEFLRGNVGDCFMLVMRARELNISPDKLINWAYVTKNGGVERIAFESQSYHAIIEARAPIKHRLKYEIIGEGDERRCRIWTTLIGEDEPRVFLSDTLGKLRPPMNDFGKVKGSPLWVTKPELQLFYNASRDFARVFFPDVLAGIYTRDEMDDAEARNQGPQNARDVTPVPAKGLFARLKGPSNEGFRGEQTVAGIDEAIAEASKPRADAQPDESPNVVEGEIIEVNSTDAPPTAPK